MEEMTKDFATKIPVFKGRTFPFLIPRIIGTLFLLNIEFKQIHEHESKKR
jgi:hypothetical protein